ncbi:MAG: HDOD domain-containing protein [Deltaproteobacteria bacterium]|nr:HDOD domain-containing protein [Deltaproteobacteria bacterium]
MIFSFKKKNKQTADLKSFEIPSFSTSVVSLLGKLRNPEIAINELTSELERDPGLYVRVLKTVNASAFGLSRKVSNIQHAVNLLGRGRLEALVLSVAVKDNLTAKNQATWLNMADFWKTASLRAAVAKTLAAELDPQTQSDVFTIGLLQDIAIPILANRHGQGYRDLFERWQTEEGLNLAELENRFFGIDHMALGAYMAECWEFPGNLIEGIGDHHDHENTALPLAVKIAALINGNAKQDNSKALSLQAAQLFNLNQEKLLPLIDQALQQSTELSAALN